MLALMTGYFILLHSGVLLLIAVFIWRFHALRLHHAAFHILGCFAVLYAFEYELFRELMRWYGFEPAVTASRMLYLRAVYLLIGVFVREVILYVELKSQVGFLADTDRR